MDGVDGGSTARDDTAAATHPLAYIRRRHGWSYQDLARVIADHARALGVPMAARREKVWRWEHWGVVPEADSQRALARALGIPPRELQTRPWPRWLPAHGGMPDGLPWTAEGSRSALSALVDDASADPRGFPIADGPALRDAIADWDAAEAEGAAPGAGPPAVAPAAGGRPVRDVAQHDLVAGPSPVAPAGAAPPADPRPAGAPPAAVHPAPAAHGDAWPPAVSGAQWAGTAAVDGVLLDWLAAGALGLRRLDDRFGGAAVRHRVEADLRLVARLLGHSPLRASAERRLLAIGADLAQLGGWAATDTGRHGAAQRHYLTGLRLAHSAGDRAMAAALWGGLAMQSVIAVRPGDAVAAAEAAVRAASGAPPAVRALAATRLGRAHAALGSEPPFRRAVAEAERQLDRAAADAGPPWLYWFGAAELAAQAGQSLLDLGRADEAAPLLERALDTQDPEYVRDRALYCASAARARALTGDLERARALLGQAAALGRICGTPRLAAALDAVRPLLAS